MGLECTIHFPDGAVPAWDAIQLRLTQLGESGSLRMIDGLPAFPDECPPPGWRELRLGVPAGMVTLRRTADGFACIVWGNAEAKLIQSRDHVAWACAQAGNGTITTGNRSMSGEEFAQLVGISPI